MVCNLNFRFMPESHFYSLVKNRTKWSMVNIVLQARKFQMVCYLNWPTCSLAFMLLMEACNKGEFHSCSMILVWALYSDGKVQVLSDFNHIWLLPKNLNGRMKASRQLLLQEKILRLRPTSLLTQYIYHI